MQRKRKKGRTHSISVTQLAYAAANPRAFVENNGRAWDEAGAAAGEEMHKAFGRRSWVLPIAVSLLILIVGAAILWLTLGF